MNKAIASVIITRYISKIKIRKEIEPVRFACYHVRRSRVNT